MRKLVIVLVLLGIVLHAEDTVPTVEQLQSQLATKDQQIAALNEQLAMIGQRHDNLMRSLTGCLGPLPQQQPQQPPLNPQQRRMMQRSPRVAEQPKESDVKK